MKRGICELSFDTGRLGPYMSHPVLYPFRMMKNAMLFPLVPAGLVLVGGVLLLAGPWVIGLPVLVAGTGELVGALWRVAWD